MSFSFPIFNPSLAVFGNIKSLLLSFVLPWKLDVNVRVLTLKGALVNRGEEKMYTWPYFQRRVGVTILLTVKNRYITYIWLFMYAFLWVCSSTYTDSAQMVYSTVVCAIEKRNLHIGGPCNSSLVCSLVSCVNISLYVPLYYWIWFRSIIVFIVSRGKQ